MILSAVCGVGYGREAQYVRAYVHRLRQKLDDGLRHPDPDHRPGHRLHGPRCDHHGRDRIDDNVTTTVPDLARAALPYRPVRHPGAGHRTPP
jgi:hypothetical protein